jgi:hypothetical protein
VHIVKTTNRKNPQAVSPAERVVQRVILKPPRRDIEVQNTPHQIDQDERYMDEDIEFIDEVQRYDSEWTVPDGQAEQGPSRAAQPNERPAPKDSNPGEIVKVREPIPRKPLNLPGPIRAVEGCDWASIANVLSQTEVTLPLNQLLNKSKSLRGELAWLLQPAAPRYRMGKATLGRSNGNEAVPANVALAPVVTAESLDDDGRSVPMFVTFMGRSV